MGVTELVAEDPMTTASEDPEGQPYADCFARACKHLFNRHCNLYTQCRPPIIVIDGRCMGFET